MGFFDRFKKKQDTSLDSIHDLALKDLRVGYFVDYSLNTWQVKQANTYDWDGEKTFEWQLASSQGTMYLELETDDELIWSLSQPLNFKELSDSVRESLLKNGEPPQQIFHGTDTYTLEGSAAGYFLENGQQNPQAERRALIQWDYANENGQKYLTIEQWGDTDFSASLGLPAQEYQFTNILPGQ